MTRLAVGIALAASLVLASGCGSSSDNGTSNGTGGGSSGGNVTQMATAACQHKEAAGCPQDDHCVPGFEDDAAIASVFGCDSAYQSYLSCLGQDGWTCETVNGGYSWTTPTQCEDMHWDYLDCKGSYSYVGGGATCQGSLEMSQQTVNASCASGSCTCTDGPKKDTTFTISECKTAPFLQGIKDNCF